MALHISVDDIVPIGNNIEACKQLKIYLNTCFSIKDLGSLKYFLGIEIAQVDQKVYSSVNRNTPCTLLMNVPFWDQNLWIFLCKKIINFHWHQDVC